MWTSIRTRNSWEMKSPTHWWILPLTDSLFVLSSVLLPATPQTYDGKKQIMTLYYLCEENVITVKQTQCS